MARAPGSLQHEPARFIRVWTRCLADASTAPEPIGTLPLAECWVVHPRGIGAEIATLAPQRCRRTGRARLRRTRLRAASVHAATVSVLSSDSNETTKCRTTTC
jgi:hypothetical protein